MNISLDKKTLIWLAVSIQERVGNIFLDQIETSISKKEILQTICQIAKSQGTLSIRNFGSFVYKIRPAIQGRNPKTGEKLIVPASCTIIFRSAEKLKSFTQSNDNLKLNLAFPTTLLQSLPNISIKEKKEFLLSFFTNLAIKLKQRKVVGIDSCGTFKLVTRNERRGRNPQTGEAIVIPANSHIKFSLDKNFSEILLQNL